MVDLPAIEQNLRTHVEILTRTIGERSVRKLWNLEKSAHYIETFYRNTGLIHSREPYPYKKETVSNIVGELKGTGKNPELYIVGAHYDSVSGTVGADDNASAVAVQLEVARELTGISRKKVNIPTVRFVSFALEEPPAYATWAMGSRVYAREMKNARERIAGMICLEMVGYTCSEPGCQGYPFPLMFLDYPKTGNYIGIVGNFKSRRFSDSLLRAFKENTSLPVEKLTVPWSGYLIPNVRLSDHASFWDEGYKAVMITDTAFYRNPYYHTRLDTMETLDYSFMSQLVKSLVHFFTTQDQSK